MRTFTRREMLRISLLPIAGSVLAACAPTAATPTEKAVAAPATKPVAATAVPTTAGKAQLRLAWWEGGTWLKPMEMSLKTFQEQKPGVVVQLESSPWPDYWQRVQVQLAGGEAPDVFWMSGAYFVNLFGKGAFLDLTDYMTRDKLDLSQYITQTDFVIQGRHYSTPFSGGGGVTVAYNMNDFDGAGISQPTNDWTWDNWREASIKLTKRDSSDKVTKWGMAVPNASEFGWLRFMRFNGGNWINEEKTKTTVNTPECVDAVKWIVDNMLVHKCFAPPADQAALQQAGITDPFLSLQQAMSLSFPFGKLLEAGVPEGLKPNVVHMPRAAANKKRWGNMNTNPMTCFKGTKHPEEAWQLSSFLASPTSMEYFVAVRSRGFSVYKPLNLDKEKGWLKPVPGLEYIDLKIFLEAFEEATGLDFHKYWFEWEGELRKPLDYAWLGQKPVQECLDEAAKTGDEVLNRKE